MPPKVAAVACIIFIAYLFYADLKRPDSPSRALWIPTIWMFLAGSRFVSAWLNLSPSFESGQDLAEGSPIDRAVFATLIVAGVVVLAQRKIDWERLLVKNGWLVLYFLYCLLSAAWAEDPALLAKRWVKDLGNPIMALVILTERRPYEAIGVILRRMAFVMLPLSVLFIKYYPELGRWHRHDGAQTFIGVGTQKNDLGLICLLTGIYVAWEMLKRRARGAYPTFLQEQKILSIVLIGMLAWLMHMANSQTSLVCLIVGIFILVLDRPAFMARRPSRIFGVLLMTLMTVLFFDQVLHVREIALSLLGRNPTLTTRTDVWQVVLSFNTDPFVGVGFMSFWTGQRLEEVWKLLGVRLNQAHNGYLEQYLNLGYIGVAFILIILLSSLPRIARHLRVDPEAAMLRLCFICVAALYNWTEASFYGASNMWMLILLGCIEVPRQREQRAVSKRARQSMLRPGLGYRPSPARVRAERNSRPERAPSGLGAQASPQSERA